MNPVANQYQYLVTTDVIEQCRERTMDATAILLRLVERHDPDERQTLIALRDSLRRSAEYLDHLLMIDEQENRQHGRGLLYLREANSRLEQVEVQKRKTAGAGNADGPDAA